MRRTFGLLAVAAFTVPFAQVPAQAQAPPPEHPVFGHTLNYGTGLIATPHALVPQSSLFGTLSSVSPEDVGTGRMTTGSGSAGLTFARFIEVGVSIYDIDEAYAGFGKVQLIKQRGIFPAMSAGLVNATNEARGRFGVEDPFYSQVQDRFSFYGVFSYVVGPGGRSFPSWVTVSAGWGSGIFLEDNPLFEGQDGTGGVFGSVAFDFQAAEKALIRTTMEWDGFDLHLGATAYLSGLELTLGVLSLDEGDAPSVTPAQFAADPTTAELFVLYNQIKPFASIALDIRALGDFPWIWTSDEEE